MAIIKQFMGNATTEQKELLFRQAKNYGVPENILAQIQNIK